MGTQTLASTATMARVNLLPPEIAERAKVRRTQVLMAATVIASVGVVGALYMMKTNDVKSAQQEVTDAKATATRLDADLAKLNNVRQILAQRDAAERALTLAMSRQVLWSNYLNNIGLSIPDNVWLRELTIKETLEGGTGPGSNPAAPAQAGVFDAGLGTVSFKGTAFEYNDVASWLESVARIKGWNNSFATLAEEKWYGPRILVEFESSVNLTPASLSGKFNKPAGS